jgi:hypothetical protein
VGWAIIAVIDHETAVLDDFDACTRKCLGHLVVSYPGLKPDGLGSFRKHVLEMRGDIFRATEHVDNIDLTGNIREAVKDLLAQDHLYVQIVDGHGDHVEPSAEAKY